MLRVAVSVGLLQIFAGRAVAAPTASDAAQGIQESIDSASFEEEDECAADSEQCAVKLLQLRDQRRARGLKLALAEEADRAHQGAAGGGKESESDTQQGNATRWEYCHASNNQYSLDWEASGSDFFNDWTFVTEDQVHGAHFNNNMSDAVGRGLAHVSDGHAFLRFGGIRDATFWGEAQKRHAVNIHTNKAWDPDAGFVAVLHYKHVPFGCGVWPGFWAMNSDSLWPNGGELDILEYANDERSKVSFHTGHDCRLDLAKIERCKPPGSGRSYGSQCMTNYFKRMLGCLPGQKRLSGADFARSPGAVILEWTSDHISVYHIPEDQFPDDLKEGRPEPSKWDKFLLAYMPFIGRCHGIDKQELVLNLQLCGDWAGGAWQKSSCSWKTGYHPMRRPCQPGLSRPRDCCTQYVTSGDAARRLQDEAFFQIKELKVYTANGGQGQPSGTFVRGGRQLH